MDKKLYRKYMLLKDDLKENWRGYALTGLVIAGVGFSLYKIIDRNAKAHQKAWGELFAMDSVEYKVKEGDTYSQIAMRTVPEELRNKLDATEVWAFIQKDLNHRETTLLRKGETIYIPKN